MHLPPLDGEELEALRATIKRFGVLVPILRNAETGALIDGHNRLTVARELGVPYLEQHVTVPAGATDDDIGMIVNAARRQLSSPQKHKAIVFLRELKVPVRVIASALGVSKMTVYNHDDSTVKKCTSNPGDAKYGYTAETRARVVERIKDGERAKDIGAELSIPTSTISNWMAQARRNNPAPSVPDNVRTLRVPPSKALSEMCFMLDGMVSTLPYIDTDAAQLTAVLDWIETMNQHLTTLHRFVKELSRAASKRQPDTQDQSNRTPTLGADSRDAHI